MGLIFYFIVVLFSSKQICFLEKSISKRYNDLALSFDSSKIYFTLLEKIIALQLILTTKHLKGPTFLLFIQKNL